MFIPTQLNVKPSRELSRAVAAELQKEDNEEIKRQLDKIINETESDKGGGNDLENKLSQTQAESAESAE